MTLYNIIISASNKIVGYVVNTGVSRAIMGSAIASLAPGYLIGGVAGAATAASTNAFMAVERKLLRRNVQTLPEALGLGASVALAQRVGLTTGLATKITTGLWAYFFIIGSKQTAITETGVGNIVLHSIVAATLGEVSLLVMRKAGESLGLIQKDPTEKSYLQKLTGNLMSGCFTRINAAKIGYIATALFASGFSYMLYSRN